MVFVGRLPSNVRCATCASGTPSARTSSAVLPNASASVWAKTLAISRSWCSPRGFSERAKRDEVARDELRALVDQLVEGVLAVRARLAPHDRAGLVVDGVAVERDVLAVALHVELLQVGGEAGEVLVVGEDGDGLGAEEVVVPEPDEAEQHGQVLRERRRAEVLVHGVEAGQHLVEVVGRRWRSCSDSPMAESNE